MARRNLLSAATWAAGSFSLALALGFPLTLNAVDHPDSSGLVESITKPRMTVNGIELSVSSDRPATQPSDATERITGQPIQFTLTAINKTNSPATADFMVQLTATSVISSFSRVPSQPMEIWKQNGTIAVNPGQSRTLSYSTVSLPENSVVSLVLGSGKNQIVALSLSPPPAPAAPQYVTIVPVAQKTPLQWIVDRAFQR